MPIKDPDLARIRDNQRRSRARRKEYLQEIETKVRQCENQGVEATSEIQVAARRVAEENRKLRALLQSHGVSGDAIEEYLQQDSIQLADRLGQVTGNNVRYLEQTLQTRHCCASDSPVYPTSDSQSRTSTIQGGGCGSENLLEARSAVPLVDAMQQRSQPTSSISSDVAWEGAPMNHPFVSLPLVPAVYAISSPDNTHPHPFSGPIESVATGTEPAIHDATLSSDINCDFATDMISTMAGGDPMIVRAQLGCVPGGDCQVNHSLVFSVMDRYSGTAV